MADLPKVSFGQLLTWDRCRFLWKLQYRDGFQSTRYNAKMNIGTMGHELLFDWYKTGEDHSDAFLNKWVTDWTQITPEQHQAIALTISMFKLFINDFSPTADRGLTVESLEEHFEVEMQTPTGRAFILEGYVDRVVRDEQGRRWVDDYKWTQRMWSPLELQMDCQLPYYAAALSKLGRPCHGTTITQVNTYPYKDRSKKTVQDLFNRERIYRSQEELDAIMWEVGMMVDDMLTALDINTPLRRSLRRDCSQCRFQEPCALGLKGIDPVGFMSMSLGFMPRTNTRAAQTLEVTDDGPKHLRI